MNIVEHELKKYDLWNDELQKKKKIDILIMLQQSSSYKPPYNRGGLITEVASLQGGNLVVFYYVSASDVWPNNRGDLS